MEAPVPAVPSRDTGLPPGVHLAPLGQRFAAFLIDSSVPAVVGIVLAVLVPGMSGGTRAALILIGAALILGWGILVWFMLAVRAASPGMQVMKLQLVGFYDGRPAGLAAHRPEDLDPARPRRHRPRRPAPADLPAAAPAAAGLARPGGQGRGHPEEAARAPAAQRDECGLRRPCRGLRRIGRGSGWIGAGERTGRSGDLGGAAHSAGPARATAGCRPVRRAPAAAGPVRSAPAAAGPVQPRSVQPRPVQPRPVQPAPGCAVPAGAADPAQRDVGGGASAGPAAVERTVIPAVAVQRPVLPAVAAECTALRSRPARRPLAAADPTPRAPVRAVAAQRAGARAVVLGAVRRPARDSRAVPGGVRPLRECRARRRHVPRSGHGRVRPGEGRCARWTVGAVGDAARRRSPDRDRRSGAAGPESAGPAGRGGCAADQDRRRVAHGVQVAPGRRDGSERRALRYRQGIDQRLDGDHDARGVDAMPAGGK